ncbi:MAG: hypothetical protein NTZ65_02780 [Candidatus Berkelbacteria bacterium]|nr:hypothetical protein [Candidatus Berkelbacteria bacterium]
MIAEVLVSKKVNRDSFFDYSIADNTNAQLYSLVEVPFGQTKAQGIIFDFKNKSNYKTKDILGLLSEGPLFTKYQIQLSKKISSDYLSSINEALFSFLPKMNKRDLKTMGARTKIKISKNQPKIAYLAQFSERIEYFCQSIIKEGQNLLVLPQINQVKDCVKRLKKLDPSIEIYEWHSSLKSRQKSLIWQKILSKENICIVSTRHGLFLPFTNLSLVMIDDPTNFAYHEDQSPYYNAFDIARSLSKIFSSKLIVGDLIPDIITYSAIKNKKIDVAEKKSKVEIVNCGSWKNIINNRDSCKKLNDAIQANSKVCVVGPFKNESRLFCNDCEESIGCANCKNEFYIEGKNLCSKCFRPQTLICPNCNGANIINLGLTYCKISLDLEKLNPDLKGKISKDPLADKQIVLVSLNDIAKLPPIFDAAIVPNFDQMAGFAFLNFREKLFRSLQSLKSSVSKNILIFSDSHQFENYFFQIQKNDWRSFQDSQLKERKQNNLPPFTKSVLAVSKNKNPDFSKKILDDFIQKIKFNKHTISLEQSNLNQSRALIFIQNKYWDEFKKTVSKSLPRQIHLEVNPVGFE